MESGSDYTVRKGFAETGRDLQKLLKSQKLANILPIIYTKNSTNFSDSVWHSRVNTKSPYTQWQTSGYIQITYEELLLSYFQLSLDLLIFIMGTTNTEILVFYVLAYLKTNSMVT